MLTKHQYVRRATTASSVLALATALVSFPAAAQLASFNAAPPTVTSGSVTVNTVGATDTFTVNSATAVLDFTPNDQGPGPGLINFQNASTTALFQGSADFTVLNRIVPVDPSRGIVFNGNVVSQVGAATGGNVWFYSPGGIVLGSSAVFDVGSLLLSTADPTGGTGTITSTNSFLLESSADTGVAVNILPGAQINALNEGSYVALVAPVVNQGGTVRVNGNAAYVAAEQATVTFSAGLFDIQVATGSDGGGTPLTHNGSTAGPSSNGAGDPHGIYMVAVPKNSAITMAIAPTGQLGFDVAASATIENGAIYLRTASIVGLKGGNPIGGRMLDNPFVATDASITYRPDTTSVPHALTSPIEAQATTNLSVSLPGISTFGGNSVFYSGKSTTFTVESGASFNASGSLTLSSYKGLQGGEVRFTALSGSSSTTAERIALGTSTLASFNFAGPDNPGGSPSGGLAEMVVRGATVTANSSVSTEGVLLRTQASDGAGVTRLIVDQGGSLASNAQVRVGNSTSIAPPSGPRRGGTALVAIDNGSIQADSMFINAPSFGPAAESIAGSAELSFGAGGGSVTVTKGLAVQASASATAPTAAFPSVVARGGSARITTAPTGSTSIIKADSIDVRADATIDKSSETLTRSGGVTEAGTASIAIGKGGSLQATAVLTMDVVARGGPGIAGGLGGSATQGAIQLSAFDGGSISFGTAKLDADTFGGAGGVGDSPTTSGGAGGAAIKTANSGAFVFAGGGGTITGGKTQVLAIARGGAGGNGFEGVGFAGAGSNSAAGSAVISTDTGGKITLGETFILAGADAGSTGTGQANGALAGGSVFGGISTLNAKNGTIDLASVVMATDVFGGKGLAIGSSGGDATGGAAFVGVTSGGSLKIGAARFEVNSSATGGLATAGGNGSVAGGKGIAGSANLTVEAGSTLETSVGIIDFRARATGGDVVGAGAGIAGRGQGGDSFFNFNGVTTIAQNVLVTVAGIGGAGGTTSGVVVGGVGQGGRATANFTGATVIGGQIQLDAFGSGGNGRETGAGGDGLGGRAQIGTFQADANTKLLVGSSVFLFANGLGASSDTGLSGAGVGGGSANAIDGAPNGANMFVTAGEFTILDGIIAESNGQGAMGGQGGSGTGGISRIGVSPNASLTANGLRADAVGVGQDSTIGGNGVSAGAATGGFADVAVSGKASFGTVLLSANATGGDVLSAASGVGGAAAAGRAIINASGGDIVVTGFISATAAGVGGSNLGAGDGGVGTGGRARISTFAFGAPPGSGGATFSVGGTTDLVANGRGGDATKGAGGAGFGGGFGNDFQRGTEIHVLGGSFTATKSVNATARGEGGVGTTISGAGIGGRVSFVSFGGNLVLQQAMFGDATGQGAFSSAGIGGSGKGGQAELQSTEAPTVGVPAGTKATVTIASASLRADGGGGGGVAGAGSGVGGNASIFISAAQNSLNASGSVQLSAAGIGASYNGIAAGAFGGVGQGGTASVSATTGSRIGFGLGIDMRADGSGGNASSAGQGSGGDGKGGGVFLTGNGGAVTIGGGSLTLSAEGSGGLAGVAAAGTSNGGGQGVGGTTDLNAFAGGSIDSSASFVSLDVSGDGGSVSGGDLGVGGAGTGGTARINTKGGSITLRSDVSIIADGGGGSGSIAGGTGSGGEARFGTFGGDTASKLTVTGDLELDASGFGGFSTPGKGGDGFGGAPADGNKGPFNKGAYLVLTGGTATIGGAISLDASGFGGEGMSGGGAGVGGRSNIAVFGATIDAPGAIVIDSSGIGGDGDALGSMGGRGQGGSAIIAATSGGDSAGGGVVTLGAPGNITFGLVSLDVSGQGGEGGYGAVASSGGLGGDGIGGFSAVTAAAGSGTLRTGDLFVFQQGVGGDGGSGGAGTPSGKGGAGGAGGKGIGGGINVGTVSGPDTPNNDGSSLFGDVSVFGQAIGGTGGNGTNGGAGGAGGAAQASNSFFLSRGAPTTAGNVTFSADAFGGAGGTGSANGAGGTAQGGLAQLAATPRFVNATSTQDRGRGSIVATSFSGSAFAIGGATGGGTTTAASTAGQVVVQVSKSDVTLGDLSLSTFADNPPSANSSISVDAGLLDVSATLTASVVGDLTLAAINGGIIRVGSLSLNSTGSLLGSTDPTAGPGTISTGGDFSADFAGDFVTSTDFNLNGSLSLTTGGRLSIGDVRVGNSVSLVSGRFDPVTGQFTGGDLSVGDVRAGSDIFLESPGAVSAGDLIAGTSIEVLSVGALQLGNLTAGSGEGGGSFFDEFGSVGIDSETSIAVGNITAVSISIDTDEDGGGAISTGNLKAEAINVESGGSLTTGDLSVGDFFSTDTSGFQDSYELGAVGFGDVSIGAVNAFKSAAIGSIEGSVTTGPISAQGSVFILAANNVTVNGGISAGNGPNDNIFISNSSILDSDPVFDEVEELEDLDFTQTAVLNTLVPVRVTGAINLNGPVTVSRFAAAASGGFKAQSITAPNRLLIDAPPPCFIGETPCGGAPVEPPPPEEDQEQELIIDRIPAVIQAALASAIASTSDPETIAALPTVNLVTTIDTAPIRTEPLITDPVTGGGNPSLWEAAPQAAEDERRPAPGPGGQQ